MVSSRFLTVGLTCLALGSVHCGGAPNLQGLNLGQGDGSGNSGNNGNNGNSGNNGNADSEIQELLGTMDAKPTDGAAPSDPHAQPAGTTVSPPTAPSPTRLDTYTEDVEKVQRIVPGWDNGTGVALRFLKESNQQRLSLIYVDSTPPAYKDNVGLWMIQAKATANGKTLGWFVMMLQDLSPGTYRGDPSSKAVVMAALMGEESWDGNNPETTWSINPESWAEITLTPGRNPGDLEGNFKARLVDNKGSGYHVIENGYIYINR